MPGRQRVMNTMRVVIMTTTPGGIGIRELKRIRAGLKRIKTKFAYIFEKRTLRFVLTNSLDVNRDTSICVLYISIESCRCGLNCTWDFIVERVDRMLNNNSRRGVLRHLQGVLQPMSIIEFKDSKCRNMIGLGTFYRDQVDGMKCKRRYGLRPQERLTYTA